MEIQEILKITDLLLNRVKNLSWYYFDIRLNDIDQSVAKGAVLPENDTAKKLLEHIEGPGEGEFTYNIESGPIPPNEGAATLRSVDLWSLLEYMRANPGILSNVMKRIFDMNRVLQDRATVESAKTSAFSGLLKRFNATEQKRRAQVFEGVFRTSPDFRNRPDHVVALAEGDSWFCFPKIHLPGMRRLFRDPIKDIIDHLIATPGYAVNSYAAGGDWLNNMLDENNQEYVEGLSKLMPDVFLVSGGGNDLVSNNRIAHMVRALPVEGRRNLFNKADGVAQKIEQTLLPLRLSQNPRPIDTDLYKHGITLLSDDFFRFINACMVQYFALFYRILIKTDKFKNMLILTQGYDFPIPSATRSGWWWTWQRLLNSKAGLNNGRWLYDSLCMRGISDPKDQRAAMYVVIYEFNEMMCKLALFNRFPNVFHIDCRGTAASTEDWFDELHLKSAGFQKISAAYRSCIKKYKSKFKESAARNETPEIAQDEKIIPVV